MYPMLIHKLSQEFVNRIILRSGLQEQLSEDGNYRFHYFDDQSDRPPIVLLNGFGISTEFQWYKMLGTLSRKYRVVLVNLLHFGKSTTIGKAAYSNAEQVDFLQHLTRRLGLTSYKIAGISYGGLIAAELAELRPEAIRELILIDSPVKFLTIESLEQMCQSFGVETIKEFFAPATAKGLQKQIKAAYKNPPFVPTFVLSGFHKALCQPYLVAWEALIDKLLEEYEQLRAREYRFDGPVKLIWGKHDRIVPLEVGQQLAQLYPNSQLIEVDAGHIPTIETPAKLRHIL